MSWRTDALRRRHVPWSIALTLVALAALVLVVELARYHAASEVAAVLGMAAAVRVAARWLLRDLRALPVAVPASGVPRRETARNRRDSTGRRAARFLRDQEVER